MAQRGASKESDGDGKDPADSITRTDETARRIANLYLCFVNASRPLSFDEIARDFYPGEAPDSARRKFHRDRAELARCGLALTRSETPNGDAWQVDADRTFAQSDALTPEEARIIDVTCLPFVSDPSFALRGDLRAALMKIDRAFSGSAVLTVRPREENRVLEALNRCLSLLHPVKATYTDAKGVTSERVLEIWGSFGFRNHVYYVCAEELPDGGLGPARTYLLDRFLSAREVRQTDHSSPDGLRGYAIPEDFSASDYRMLPFQIGDDDFELAALAPSPARASLETQIDGRGKLRPISPDDEAALEAAGISADEAKDAWIWQVSARDARRAAAWCIAQGILPVSPRPARSAWKDLLTEGPAHTRDNAPASARPTRPKRAKAGRPDAGAEARDLIALISSLSKAGDTISADVVAARLGITRDRACQLLYLLVTASATGENEEGFGYLSLDYEALGSVTLSFDTGVKGRPVRLTEAETAALTAALGEAGITAESDLYRKIHTAFSASSRDASAIVQDLDAQGANAAESAAIGPCAQAIADGSTLAFNYEKPGSGATASRSVMPREVYKFQGHWYLEAIDMGDDVVKRFRLDRMSGARPQDAPRSSMTPAGRRVSTRMVPLTFHGHEPLDLFWWDGLAIDATHENGDIDVEVPYYGGDWLIRHLAACGPLVTIRDAEMDGKVRDYARGLLLRHASI